MPALEHHTGVLSHRTYAHLTATEVESIGRALDALREDVLASRGADHAAYIRRLIAVQKAFEDRPCP